MSKLPTKIHSIINWIALMYVISGCTFNFEITSQRTSLENQIMGTHSTLDDPLICAQNKGRLRDSSVAEYRNNKGIYSELEIAKLNRIFNADDIENLKNNAFIGETSSGLVQILPAEILNRSVSSENLRFADLLIQEENRDRKIIWRASISNDVDASKIQLEKISTEFFNKMYADSPNGHWFLFKNKWVPK